MGIGNQLDPRMANWVFKNFKKAELIFLTIFVIGFALKISAIHLGEVLITLSISALAVLYFFRAYKVFEDADRIEIILNKLLPYGWSICVIAIMFSIQGWPGFEPMLIVGSFIQIALLAVILFFHELKGIKYPTINKNVLLRSFIIAGLAISLYFCPKEILIKHNIITKQLEQPQN